MFTCIVQLGHFSIFNLFKILCLVGWQFGLMAFQPLVVYLIQKSYQLISLVCRVFTNCPGDLDSIPVRVIPKTLKMVLDTSLLNPQQYELRIEGKMEKSRERIRTLPYTSV